MKDYSNTFPMKQMACILGVSRSGYYNFIKRGPSKRTLENKELVKKIRMIFEASNETYGSHRIHAELLDQGVVCSRSRIARLMSHHHIQAKMYKRFVKTTKRSTKTPYPTQDLVQQDFCAPTPNRLWVADITYIAINQRWAYLAIILDLFSRKVVGMAIKENMKTPLILEALNQALLLRRPAQGLIHHSDLGSQYTSHELYKVAQYYGKN